MSADVLIVEDEMLVACEMEAILEENGYRCAGIVPDLTAAARFFGQPLDVALVDLNLRDGFTGPQIGEQLSQSGIPVIFITANPTLLGDGIAGTIGVLTKPTDEKTLLQAVAYALGWREGRMVEPPAEMRLFA